MLPLIYLDNSQVPYPTPGAFLAFVQAAANYVTALVLNARTLKDDVSAATTAQALAAIDPSKGWQQQIATARAYCRAGTAPGDDPPSRGRSIEGCVERARWSRA
jgi:hypothetical protein